MKIPVESRFDSETRLWCVGMVVPPWVASCGKTLPEAKAAFAEAFRAYFEAARRVKRGKLAGKTRLDLVIVA